MTINSRCRDTLNSQRKGAAVVELAVLLPFLLFMTVISADWARIYHMTISANACARNGAFFASDPIYAASSPYTDYQAAALAEAPSLPVTPTVSKSLVTD